MSFKSEIILNWTDPDGLVQPHINPNINDSGNGLLYTGEYLLTLALTNQLSDLDKNHYVRTESYCEVEPGLIKRSPTKTDQESKDDYYGVAIGSALADPSIAKRILSYGRNNPVKYWGPIKLRYVYNNVNPGQWGDSAWLGRDIRLIACLEWAAGETPNLFRRLYTAFSIAFLGNPDDNNSWILTSLAVQLSKDSFICRQAAKLWRKRLYKRFPGGMKDVLKAYFNNNHPLGNYYVTP